MSQKLQGSITYFSYNKTLTPDEYDLLCRCIDLAMRQIFYDNLGDDAARCLLKVCKGIQKILYVEGCSS
jgi:hypothetical protein